METTSAGAVAHRLLPPRADTYVAASNKSGETMMSNGAAAGWLPNSTNNLSTMPIDTQNQDAMISAGADQGISPELAEVLAVNGLSAHAHAVRQVSVDMHDLARLRPEEVAAVAANLPTPAKRRAWEAVVKSAAAALLGTSGDEVADLLVLLAMMAHQTEAIINLATLRSPSRCSTVTNLVERLGHEGAERFPRASFAGYSSWCPFVK